MAAMIHIDIPKKFLQAIYRNNESFETGYEECADQNETNEETTSSRPDPNSNNSIFTCPICLQIARAPIIVPC